MTITISKDARLQAIGSIERYFRDELEQPIGNIESAALLAFFTEELGPLIYNQAVLDVQGRMLERVQELDIEVHEHEFQYWHKRRPR